MLHKFFISLRIIRRCSSSATSNLASLNCIDSLLPSCSSNCSDKYDNVEINCGLRNVNPRSTPRLEEKSSNFDGGDDDASDNRVFRRKIEPRVEESASSCDSKDGDMNYNRSFRRSIEPSLEESADNCDGKDGDVGNKHRLRDVNPRIRQRLEEPAINCDGRGNVVSNNRVLRDVNPRNRRRLEELARNCDGRDYELSDNRVLRDVNLTRLEEPTLIKLKRERNPDKLFRLFEENARNRVVVENRFAFEDTVARLAGAGRYDYIERLLEQQKSLPQGRREGFLVRIIMLYGRAGMIKQAVDTFYDMHLFGCRRTVKSLNAALKVLTQTRDLEVINSFLDDAPCKFGIALDVISLNTVVCAFCGIGLLDEAYLLMVVMEKDGIKPDVVTYTTLISAFYKCDRWVIGNGLWNLMIYKGCYPNVATFNARIQFMVSNGRAWQANDLLGLMEKLKITPDEVTYNLVIKGFCRAGFFDIARRVYSALHGRGYKANVKIYQTMVHYLCKAGNFDSAYSMCKECMKKNWILNVDTICTLLEGLKSIGQVHKAWMIIGLAERRRPPFPDKQLDAFKSILANG